VRVLLFTRYPAPGRAKTRLGADIGHGHAANLQAAFVLDEMQTLSGLDAAVTLCCDPSFPLEDYQALFGPDPDYAPQRGADLGRRMLNALNGALESSPAGAVLIGSDLPDLPAARITAAFEALAGAPVCLGPSPDGGFHLLGLSRPQPFGLFDAVSWGGDGVLDRTLANCAARGLRPAVLEPWPDVDTVADLRDYARRNRGRDTQTMDYIRSQGLVPDAWKD
jgi:rSAM/selenodomain-associated transferase 1